MIHMHAYSDLVAAISSELNHGTKRCVVGISGIDCAGKSTLAERLALQFTPEKHDTIIISIDDFLNPKGMRHAGGDPAYNYFEKSFDFATFFRTLLPAIIVREDVDIELPVRDIDTDVARNRRFKVSKKSLIIVEGVFLFQKPYINLFSLRVWLSINCQQCLDRARVREFDLDHYKTVENIEYNYLSRFIPGQKLHADRDDPASSVHFILKG